jgi:CRISPR-associated protein (TIGR02710 family)
MNDQPERMLIATIGNTPEPIALAIAAHEPTRVALVASGGSLPTAREVLARFGFDEAVWSVEDAESLSEAYRTTRKELATAFDRFDVAALIVDVTGGTKAMATGVALACRGIGATFSYVGGTQRDAVGRVVTGSERLRVLDDPTAAEADAAWWTLRGAWNAHAYAFGSAVARRAEQAAVRSAERAFHRAMAGACAGMAAWDAGDYPTAHATLLPAVAAGHDAALRLRHGEKERVLRALMPFASELQPLLRGDEAAIAADVLRSVRRRLASGGRFDAFARLSWIARRIDRGSTNASLQAWLERCDALPIAGIDERDVTEGITVLAALGFTPASERPGW